MKQGKDILEVVEKINDTIGDTEDTNIPTELKGKSLVEMCVENFTCASNGRVELAKEITGKGIPTNATDTLKKMAQNVHNIKVGYGSGDKIPTDKVSITYKNSFGTSFNPEVLSFKFGTYTGMRLYDNCMYLYNGDRVDKYDESTKAITNIKTGTITIVDQNPGGDSKPTDFVFFTLDSNHYTVRMHNSAGTVIGSRDIIHVYDGSYMYISMFYAYRSGTDIYLIVQASYGNNCKPVYLEKFSMFGSFKEEIEIYSHDAAFNMYRYVCDDVYVYQYDWRDGYAEVYFKDTYSHVGRYNGCIDREDDKFFLYDGYVLTGRGSELRMVNIVGDDTITFPEITGQVTGMSPVYGEKSFYVSTPSKTYKIKKINGVYTKEAECVTIEHTLNRPLTGRQGRFCMSNGDGVFMYNRDVVKTVDTITVK